nr:sporulation protein YabP [uncultured Solibaculum sp.]
MTEEKKTMKMPHNVILEDRRNLTVSGVSDVDSFDEQNITVFTDMGELAVRGYNLHINKLNIETGELTLEGEISSLIYTDEQQRGSGFFGRLFK